jgi:hypothetical protein
MVQQLIKQPEHRNSLGYVISQRGSGMGPEDAMIVWGIKPDGTRLFIDRARRGAVDHLKCECGAELIARKGDVRAHHFAHASGTAQRCWTAHLNALSKFAADALDRFHKVRIPQIPGKREIAAFVQAAPEVFDDYGGVRIAGSAGGDRRELCILFTVTRGKVAPLKKKFAQSGISAMLVDLSQFRNLPDERIAKAVAFEAKRWWLYNSRHPEFESSPVKGPSGQINSSSCTWHRGGGRSSPAQFPAIEKMATGERARADADAHRTRPAGGIGEVDWDNLSPAELRRRLFGDRFGD